MTEYLDLPDLLHVALRAIGPPPEVRDVGLLESVLARPRATAFGDDAYADLETKAAAFVHSLARNRALVDGNKRFALSGLFAFLDLDGRRLTWSNDEAYDAIIAIASGELDPVEQIADLIRASTESCVASMRITKFGHACVRIENDGTTVVIDPGMFTDPEAVDGADVVLVTHEHPDHWTADNLRSTDARIVTIAAVRDAITKDDPAFGERISVVAPGDTFDAGFPVTAVGEMHAVIHRDIPRVFNSGYLLDVAGTTVYHPGDALTAPEQPVDVLLAPSSAPWLRSEMAIDFVREVGAPTNLSIHDRIYTEAAHGILGMQMQTLLPETQRWVRVADGEDLRL